MYHKKYFGASEDAYNKGKLAMAKKLKNTTVVRDVDGNLSRVSTDDPRYISGELVAYNKGKKNHNSASKRKDVMNKIISSREQKYDSYSTYTFDELVSFMVDAYMLGKSVFNKKGTSFGSNYTTIIMRTKFNKEEVYNSVVQRLSKV